MAASSSDKLLKATRRFSTTLVGGGIADASVTTGTLDATTNLATDTAVALTFDRVDSQGKKTPDKEESVVAVVSGSNITNMVRGFEGTAQAHSAGAVVECRLLAGQWNRLIDHLLVEHNQNGTHKSGLVTTLKASASDVAAATDDTKIVTPLAAAPYGNTSMSRQAIMNGNFDVWQRGTSVAIADVTKTFLADRWFDNAGKDGGTPPTLTRSRQLQTSGDIWGSYYFTRLATNGAGSSFGANSYHMFGQAIENGTRNLCGASKKVTLSFWARSSISNKKLGTWLEQNYGTGGTPTAAENIAGTTFTLTASWVKYTYTFTTNTLASKTFGTANDDALILYFTPLMGANLSAARNGTTIATYEGSGTIDIAQVQLCAGDVALPFQPKSFEEELRACQRYYEKSFDYSIAPIQNCGLYGGSIFWQQVTAGATLTVVYVPYKVTKRITPSPILYNPVAANAQVRNFTASSDCTLSATNNNASQFGFTITATNSAGAAAGNSNTVHWTADAEL